MTPRRFFVGRVVGLLVLLGIVGIGAAFYSLNNYIYQQKQADESMYNFGTYGYRCEEGTEFTMSVPEDMESILLIPARSVERISRAILSKAPSATGSLYEGNGIRFHAHGETIELSTGGTETICRPIQNSDEAPFNFGD